MRAQCQAARRETIVARLRAGLTTARTLGAITGATDRTIYRDIAKLRASGLRIAGQAGVGFLLRGARLS